MNKEEKLNAIEKYIDELTYCLGLNLSNINETEDVSANYIDNKDKLEYHDFIFSADAHYFIFRVLFLSGLLSYSFFAGQQCVELYLKAFIKFKGNVPPDGHDLIKLIVTCRSLEQNGFVVSDRIMTIAQRFNPFYEYPRYPVQKKRPKGPHGFVHPLDVEPLDYFVFKMREIMPYPNNKYDLLSEGCPYGGIVTAERTNFINTFKSGNLNFT